MINTFGLAALTGRGARVSTEQPTANPVGTDSFEYNLRVNNSRTIDIQFRDNFGVTINVEMGEHTITQVRISPEGLRIGANYYLVGDQLTQRFILAEPTYPRPVFRLMLLHSQMVRRVDLRYLNYSWVTMVIHNNRIMAVALNGDNLVESLEQMGVAAVERGVTAQSLGRLPSYEFGLSSGHQTRESRASSAAPSRSTTPQPNQGAHNVVMPRLVPYDAEKVEQPNKETPKEEMSGEHGPSEGITEGASTSGLSNAYTRSVSNLLAYQLTRRKERYGNDSDSS